MNDLDLSPTPLQLECERLRKETEMAKEMLGRMMAEFAELQDKYNEAVLMQCTSPYPDSHPCRGITSAVIAERQACLSAVRGVMVTDHGLNTWKRCVAAIEKRANASLS